LSTNTFIETDPHWTAASNAIMTSIAARLPSNIWVSAGSTTNYLPRTGGTMSGALNLGAQVVSNVAYIDFCNNDVSVGRGADGSYSGVALGLQANGSDSGVALGRQAQGTNYGVAAGRNATGDYYGAALGYLADGSVSGVAVGVSANGCSFGVAVGASAYGCNGGVALGWMANSYLSGVSVGQSANRLFTVWQLVKAPTAALMVMEA
jgi:hypothetical protein